MKTEKILVKSVREYRCIDDAGNPCQKGKIIGMVMSTGRGLVGYAFANTKRGDFYDRELAEKICISRMGKNTLEKFEEAYSKYIAQAGNTSIAKRIHGEMCSMVNRSEKYFKD